MLRVWTGGVGGGEAIKHFRWCDVATRPKVLMSAEDNDAAYYDGEEFDDEGEFGDGEVGDGGEVGIPV